MFRKLYNLFKPSPRKPQIKLRSLEHKEFLVDMEVVHQSTYLKQALEGLRSRRELRAGVVPIIILNNIRADVLKHLISWMQYHKKDPPPIPEEEYQPDTPFKEYLRVVLDSWWDKEIFASDRSGLELILAADYLKIERFKEIFFKRYALYMSGPPGLQLGLKPQLIRKHFKILKDFTPEEEDLIRCEIEWCSERETVRNRWEY